MKENKKYEKETTAFVSVAKDIYQNNIVKIILLSALAIGVIYVGGKVMKVCAGAVRDYKELKTAIKL